jgi:hypothetical protein
VLIKYFIAAPSAIQHLPAKLTIFPLVLPNAPTDPNVVLVPNVLEYSLELQAAR